MPLNDNAVVLPANAHILLGTVGTATEPTAAAVATYVNGGFATPPTNFTDLGHTNIDEIVGFDQDGGDSEVKGSLQNKSLREIITKTAVDYLSVKSLQLLDKDVLNLYYGGGTSTVGKFATPDTAVIVEKAFLMCAQDASGPFALFVPRASVRRDDSISMPSDEFASVPLRFTFLKQGALSKLTWIGAQFT